MAYYFFVPVSTLNFCQNHLLTQLIKILYYLPGKPDEINLRHLPAGSPNAFGDVISGVYGNGKRRVRTQNDTYRSSPTREADRKERLAENI